MKILIVEDVEDSRIVLEDILATAGYEVSSAINGIDALEKIKSSKPELIISDILMPEMDGFELCRTLKHDPQFKSILFIFYTATYTDSSDEKFALALGADRFIVKPEEPAKLLHVIKKLIAQRHESGTQKQVFDIENSTDLKSAYAETLSKKLNKKVEDLELQQEQLKIITDAMPALISEINEASCYEYVNSAYEKWFDLPRDEIIGKRIIDVVGEELHKRVQPYIEKALNGEEAVFEGYVKDAHGNARYVLARYIPYLNEKMKARHCFSLINDLTVQKQAEDEKQKLLMQLRQSQKMDAIGHIAGGIAHDFNNILTIILGYTDLISLSSEEAKTNKLDEYTEQIREAGFRGQDLISQIMKFTRKSDEQLEYSVDIKPPIEGVVRLVEETFPATIKIDTDLEEIESLVVIEITQLHQILVNLLVNARDAINVHGRIEVKLKQEKVSSVICDSCKKNFEGEYIVLSVSDNGEGIKQDYLDKIFELFYTSKEMGKGTGIGLSMVHSIVHKSRGHILINSTVGKGTTFKIYFPISELKEKILEQDNIKVISNDKAASKSTIMIVDDETSIVEYLDILFSQNGYKTKTFTSSLEALNALQLEPDIYGLVITDQTMPEMTGVEMSEKILQIRPELPIIICSGNLSDVNDYIKKIGVKVVLQKPVTTKELLQVVEDYIS